MNRLIIPFTTEEAWLENRLHDLTSSDVPCLFGVGYQSYDGLFKCKLNKISAPFKDDERKQSGKCLEPAIAQEFARQNKWTIRHKNEYIRIPELRLASSFDYEISHEDVNNSPEENELLEVKNVDYFVYKKSWITSGFEIQSTPYIEIQIQNELLVSGLKVGYIGALIGGNQWICLRRPANKKIQDAILNRAKLFWRAIDENCNAGS